MCSNYQSIQPVNAEWVLQIFDCELPKESWRAEIFPTYPSPFIYFNENKLKFELAEFGLRPLWAKDRKFGTKT